MIEEFLQEAIQLVQDSQFAYCHYITPNDVGKTGGHQCGFTFAKPCFVLFFDEPGIKGETKDRFIEIDWQNGRLKTNSRAVYYGDKTRNEYRITRFGKGFEFLREDYIGSLQIMTRDLGGQYHGYVLSNQDNIEDFWTSTPLTYRDYTAIPEGSAFGVRKSCNNVIGTVTSPATPLPNLFLAGQNLMLHGMLGTAMTSLLTCNIICGRNLLESTANN